jgi:succinoglycan biosynthesis transport protein ExoP
MVLHAISNIATGDQFYRKGAGDKEYMSFRDVWSFITRHILMLIFCMVLGLAAGLFYTTTTQPTYTATTTLVMDPEQGRISQQDVATGAIIIETAEIASQVEIVKSEAVAMAVIRKLGLNEDPEITKSRSWQSKIRGLFGSAVGFVKGEPVRDESDPAEQLSEAEIMRRTMASFLGRVSVRRVGQSYVLEIAYTSTDPKKAAAVANALAQAYIRAGMNDRSDMARSGAKWLETRLVEVGAQAREAAMAAEEYRAKHGITVVNNTATLDQQQLSEISSQMLAARAATAAESAKLTTLQRLIAGSAPDASFDDVTVSTQIQKLRDDVRAAETRLAALRSRYKDGNPAISAAEANIARLKEAINNEFLRIEGVYRSNLSTARTREKLVEAQLEELTRIGAAKNSARAELAEIESRANTYRRIYEGLLQQLVGTVQTQSFPLGKARIVTPATAPLTKTWPKTSIILPFSMAMGLAFGFVLVMARTGLDRRTSSADRLRRELGITSLGHVPLFERDPDAASGKNPLPASMAPLRCVLDSPYSRFSESLRGVKNSVDAMFPENASMAIGVTSVGSGEGKTTISTNLAQLYQNEGRQVLLIDADFVSTRLSRVAVNFPADFGVGRLTSGEVTELYEAPDEPPLTHHREGVTATTDRHGRHATAEKVHHHPAKATQSAARSQAAANLHVDHVPVLTVAQIRERTQSHQRYGHLPALKAGIEKLRRRYDVIVVDMSGFEESADTRAICTYLDGIIVVLGRSDKMTIERLRDALATFGKSRISLLGTISNRISPPRRQARGKWGKS